MKSNAEVLFERFDEAGLDYGEILQRSLLDSWFEACGLAYPMHGSAAEFKRVELKRLSAFSAFSDRLLKDRQMWLRSDRAGNYSIVEPQQQTNLAVTDAVRKMKGALGKAERQLQNVKREALTIEERARNAAALAKIGAVKQLAGNRRALLSGVPEESETEREARRARARQRLSQE